MSPRSPESGELDNGTASSAGNQAVSARTSEIFFFALGVAAIGCWLALYRWYSLFKNKSNTHFAFEKIPGQFDSPILRRTLVLFLAVSLIYAIGYMVLRGASRMSARLKIGVVVAILGPGIVNLILYPVGALDVFNYMIELKLQYHYNVNPYIHTFEAYRKDSFALPAFLVNTPLFYGPVWLIVSRLPGMIVGYSSFFNLLIALKIFNFALLGLTAFAIAWRQETEKGRWLAVYLFLANPLVLFEALANAHNDVMMTVFLIGALVLLERKSQWSGAMLAASALVKFFTVALAPIFVVAALRQRWGVRRIVWSTALAGVAVVATTAPFWANGKMIDGLRTGTEASQEMNHVSIYSLAQQYERERENDRIAKLSGYSGLEKTYLQTRQLSSGEKKKLEHIFLGLFIVGALILLVTYLRGRPIEYVIVDTLVLFCLLLTNLYAWYLIPVFAALALRRSRLGTVYVFAGTALGLAYYPFYVYAHFSSGWQNKFHVHLFLSLFLTVPMVLFLIAEAGEWALGALARRRAAAKAPLPETPGIPRRTSVTSS